MFNDRARDPRQGRAAAATAGCRSGARSTCRRAGPTAATAATAATSSLVADPDLRDLSALQRRRWIAAAKGGNGRGARKHGADGDDVEVRVPVGTQVFDGDDLVADLAHPGARVVLARGGRGGRGNARFVSSTRQVPRFAEVGHAGRGARPRAAPEAARRRGARRPAERRQVVAAHAHLERAAEGRRLPVHDARSRCSGRSSRPTAASSSSPTCPG